ncbi:transketolase family protein [Candidatus Pacearchaeota archaeon]|nr:transketolase family protein [Candidatus Pacearchaeota archaeon]
MKKEASREGYGRALVKLGEKNKEVVALCCDLTDSTRVELFKKKFPERFIEIGVAEQNMAGIAAGLAMLGKIPFMSSYAVFSPGRNWDQIRVSICYNNVDVKIQGAHAGISVGRDGATHQALEDIAITRVLPNMTVLVPCDSIQAEKATIASASKKGPVYIRLSRTKTPLFTDYNTPFKIGKADIYRSGSDVCIISCGTMVYESLIAADDLAREGIKATVMNCHSIKPIDNDTISSMARKCGAVVTAEEHQINGGLGGAVAEVLGKSCPVPIEMVGVLDTFGESGEPEELIKKYGCTSKEIISSVKAVLKRKR